MISMELSWDARSVAAYQDEQRRPEPDPGTTDISDVANRLARVFGWLSEANTIQGSVCELRCFSTAFDSIFCRRSLLRKCLEAFLAEAGFSEIKIEPKDESREQDQALRPARRHR